MIGMGYTYGKQLTLFSWIPKNHIETFLKLFQPQIITSALAHILAGGVLVRSYLGLYGRFNSLTVTMVKGGHTKYLNVPHIFLVLSGCYTGFTLWKDFHFKNKNVLQFPMIEQTGNSQLTRRMSKMINYSLVKVVLELKWFILFHFFIGYSVVDVLSEISFLEPSVNQTAYVVSNLLSFDVIDVLSICIFVNTLVTLSLVLLRTVLCINFTKRLRFDVTGKMSIVQGMSSDNDLLSHLAFYDFSLLSVESKVRRSEFFALSQPGGHPHNWKGLKKACLDKIQDFIKQLTDSAAPQPVNPAAAICSVQDQKKSQPVLYSHGRNLVSETHLSNTNTKVIAQNNNNATKDLAKDSKNLLSKIPFGAYPMKVLKTIKDKCSNNALINSAPDAGVRAVFAKSQIIIWAVEGMYFDLKF